MGGRAVNSQGAQVNQRTFGFKLAGPGGEPIDLWRTLDSHGLTSLPPLELDEEKRALEVTIPVARSRPRMLRISTDRTGFGRVEVLGRRPSTAMLENIKTQVSLMLRLDEDLSDFYAQIAQDPELAWAQTGAGRLMRSPTVFEDVIKTICTTNCAWSATVRMVRALCEYLGDSAPGAPAEGWKGRVFPSAEQMAAAGEDFYMEVVRAGYRTRYMRTIARDVADGALDLEALGQSSPEELPDEALEARLLELPGVGPYAAAHIMLLLGRYSRLILDSWTRPTYARLTNQTSVSDEAIERRFQGYGRYAGLAFWLFVTRDWVDGTS